MLLRLIILLSLVSFNIFAREAFNANRYGALSGIQSEDQIVHIKSNDSNGPQYHYNKEPSAFLVSNYLLISPNSKILDLSMREGHNSIFLAIKGHRVFGNEPDKLLFDKALRQARDLRVRVEMSNEEISSVLKGDDRYDVVLISNIAQRRLFKAALKKVKSGGLLIIEAPTFNNRYRSNTRLGFNELLSLYAKEDILSFLAPNLVTKDASSIIIRKKSK